MLNAAWFVFILVFCFALLKWRSPLLLLAPNLFLVAFSTPLHGDNGTITNFILWLWFLVLWILALYAGAREIRLDNVVEISGNFCQFNKKSLVLFAFAIFLLIAILVIWLRVADISEFSSSKRVRDSGALYNVVNFLLKIFILHATIVLSLFEFRLRNPHVLFAFVSLLVAILVGYLSSSRGLFVSPLMIIFFFRVCRLQSLTDRIYLVVRFAVPAAFVLILMALISSERRGEEGLMSGFQIIGEQLIDSETGYGLAPSKDAVVLSYSSEKTVPQVGITLLGGFYGLVPRFVWEGKPQFVGTGPLAGAFVFRGQDYWTQGAGIPISFPSELALAFGSKVFIPGMIVTCVLMILTTELLRPFPVLIFALVPFYNGLMAHGLPKSQVTLLLDIIVIFTLVRCVGLRVYRT